jgi:predicted nucleic acid-binding protein
LFVAADAGVIEIVTLLEVPVAPHRAKNDAMTKRCEALLTRSRGVNLVELSRQQLRRAAAIRAHYGARTPDALQLAAALDAGCMTFVTNDRRIPDVAGLRVFQLTAHAP